MSRSINAGIAADTMNILQRGFYIAPSGTHIELAAALQRTVNGTTLHTPAELDQLVANVAALPAEHDTTVMVTNETTLAVARRLAQAAEERVVCLNFASAKNPGGGFLGGAQAQEESLARCSGLYFALRAQPAFYQYHRQQGNLLYSDHMIYAPEVPVFRADDGGLFEQPYALTMITSPAPNAGAIKESSVRQRIPSVLQIRSAKILALAHHQRHQQLILGAWGCGVFKNDPALVAQTFHMHLAPDGLFHNRFALVIFAIYDRAQNTPTLNAFTRVFDGL